jgi:uncharacterized membrane protein
MSTTTDRRIDRYLRELDDALKGLPASGRREIVDEIRGHIDEARAQGGAENDTEIAALLERLGQPEDIAAEARERFGIRAANPGWVEVIALVMLPIGAIVLPFLGWVIGVVCLWVSPLWTARDKLIGTLVLPGGLLLPVGLGFFGVFGAIRHCTTSATTSSPAITQCSGPNGILTIAIVAAVVVMFALPLLTDVYLYRRLRRAT